ncbi:MAG: Maf family nucleotide pyrophosphatase [Pseudomonadales bacterium]|nr:Maf family nucleotide pyrophosphatase [Pseudomonadales bacterium]
MHQKFVLASTSSYRAQLLSSVIPDFSVIDPKTDETSLAAESPKEKCVRLSVQKALDGLKLATGENLIAIGSDQVAHLGDRTFSKPGDFDTAMRQLKACSNNWVSFSTGIALCQQQGDLVDDNASAQILAKEYETYRIKFRKLADKDIADYLKAEEPYDCAGSVKAEGLGIRLIEDSQGRDINTLYGLPLMLLTDLLNNIAVYPPYLSAKNKTINSFK